MKIYKQIESLGQFDKIYADFKIILSVFYKKS